MWWAYDEPSPSLAEDAASQAAEDDEDDDF